MIEFHNKIDEYGDQLGLVNTRLLLQNIYITTLLIEVMRTIIMYDDIDFMEYEPFEIFGHELLIPNDLSEYVECRNRIQEYANSANTEIEEKLRKNDEDTYSGTVKGSNGRILYGIHFKTI